MSWRTVDDDPEPAVPDVATTSTPDLPDAEVVAALAAATCQAGARLLTTRLRSVHQRPGRSRTHVHEATIAHDGAERDVLLVAHRDRRPLPAGALVLRADGREIAVWRFPHDPWLPGLPSALDPGRVRELLDGLGAPAGDVELRTRAYRPTRRAVVEVMVAAATERGRILYLKLLAGERAAEVAWIHRELVDTLPVPRVVGLAAAQGVVALEARPGATLRATLVEGGPLPEPGALVELSDRLAATEVRTRRDPRAFADPRRHVAGLAELVPARRDELAWLAGEAAAVSGTRVPVHGDLHDGQVLLTGGEVSGLLDLDGVGTGLVAHDAGSLVAHVEAVGEVWPAVADRATAFAAEVADAYRARVGPDALARATAGTWLALATGPHRAQDPGWLATTHARIDRAAASLTAVT